MRRGGVLGGRVSRVSPEAALGLLGGRWLAWGGPRRAARMAGLGLLVLALGRARGRWSTSNAAVARAVGMHPRTVQRWCELASMCGMTRRTMRGSVGRRLTTEHTVAMNSPAPSGPGVKVETVLEAIRLSRSLAGAAAVVVLWGSPAMSGRELARVLGLGLSRGCQMAALLRPLAAMDRASSPQQDTDAAGPSPQQDTDAAGPSPPGIMSHIERAWAELGGRRTSEQQAAAAIAAGR